MATRPNVRSVRELNATIPPDLTDQLVQRLLALPESPKAIYLKEQLLSKFVSKDTDSPQLRRSRAIAKWLETESRNEDTEERLILTREDYQILPRVTYLRFMDYCRDLILRVLGDDMPCEEGLWELCAFSGGASTSRSRTQGHPAFKYVGRAHITLPALYWWDHCVAPISKGWVGQFGNSDFDIEVVPGNVLFTVPKKADIDRVACKEPDLNMYMQKGVGAYLRKRLRRFGINLNDQSINRSLARRGSVDGSLATLDLSSASDSLTCELVSQLLPECWNTLLADLRSPVTVIDGEVHRNTMISSMGNGFTFELISLVFWVLCKATCYFTGSSGIVSVYGDDIIVPSKAAHYCVSVLNYVGFLINDQKSFIEGPFRESCGGHYHGGFDITPFYITEPIVTIDRLILAANQLRKWGDLHVETTRLTSIVDPDVEQIWIWLRGFVPRCLWGGGNLESKYQLVAYCEPQMRLSEEVDRKRTGTPGFIHWLNATGNRTGPSDAVVTSSRSVSLNKLRLRPVGDATVPRLTAFMLSELDVDIPSKQNTPME